MMKPYFTCQYGDLYCGDCLEVMPDLAKNGVKVDMVLTDPPYGTTQCKWDSVVPLDDMWESMELILKDRTAIILFASQPFTSVLVSSKIDWFKYDWVWKKLHTGQLDAKRRPLRNKEDILVFGSQGKIPAYYPQMSVGKPYTVERKGYKGSECYGKQKDHTTVSEGKRYPLQILECKDKEQSFHPTQKPVSLMEYLIKTYTLPEETVLDFTIGSGTTAVAAVNTGRHFIGIEREEKYCEIAAKRILGVL